MPFPNVSPFSTEGMQMGPKRPTHITQESWDAAINDPAVHKLWAESRELAETLVARGHCPCHLVVHCPDGKS